MKLVSPLKNIGSTPNFHEFSERLKSSSFRYFYVFKSFKAFSSIFTKLDVSELTKLASNKDIIISKPDKGRGVVLVDRVWYIELMYNIILDRRKFE